MNILRGGVTRRGGKLTHPKGQLCIGDDRANLSLVTDNLFVLEEPRNILVGERGHAFGIEPLESATKCLTAGKNRAPGEAHLKSFEAQGFEESPLIGDGHAPFGVVVVAQKLIGHPHGVARGVFEGVGGNSRLRGHGFSSLRLLCSSEYFGSMFYLNTSPSVSKSQVYSIMCRGAEQRNRKQVRQRAEPASDARSAL